MQNVVLSISTLPCWLIISVLTSFALPTSKCLLLADLISGNEPPSPHTGQKTEKMTMLTCFKGFLYSTDMYCMM